MEGLALHADVHWHERVQPHGSLRGLRRLLRRAATKTHLLNSLGHSLHTLLEHTRLLLLLRRLVAWLGCLIPALRGSVLRLSIGRLLRSSWVAVSWLRRHAI